MEAIFTELAAIVEQIVNYVSGLDFTALTTAISDFIASLGA